MSSECVGTREDALRRVRSEFREMPGLQITPAQAGRLWGLDAASCQALLDELVEARFLFRTRNGSFMRVADTEVILPRGERAPARPAHSASLGAD